MVARVAAVAAMLGGVAMAGPVAGAWADPTPAQAIAELNGWRSQVGESPVATADVAAWDTGCRHHNGYMQYPASGHGLTHDETDTDPTHGYTTDGSVAGPDSVLAEAQTTGAPLPDGQLLPGPTWDSAVFHRAALLQPRLARVGFDSSTFTVGGAVTTWSCLWLQSRPSDPSALASPAAIDNAPANRTGAVTLLASPANGAEAVPTAFPAGSEEPDPAKDTNVPPGAQLGWLISVALNGPWANGGGGGIVWAQGVQASLTAQNGPTAGTAVPVAISECGSAGCAALDQTATGGTVEGPYLGGGFGIFPLQSLALDTTYRVAITGGEVHDESAGAPGTTTLLPASAWCFSTGQSFVATVRCPLPGSGAAREPGAATAPPSPPAPTGSATGGASDPATAGASTATTTTPATTSAPATTTTPAATATPPALAPAPEPTRPLPTTTSPPPSPTAPVATAPRRPAAVPVGIRVVRRLLRRGARRVLLVQIVVTGRPTGPLPVSVGPGTGYRFATAAARLGRGIVGRGVLSRRVRAGRLLLTVRPATGTVTVTVAPPALVAAPQRR